MSDAQPLRLRHPRYAPARIEPQHDLFCVHFQAMASDCELLLDLATADPEQASLLAEVAVQEVWRLEEKYSRYLPDNDFARLHQHPDEWQPLDDETARLLTFAGQAWQLSDGRFDLTSGILRTLWTFDGSDRLPDEAAIAALLPRIGWQKLAFRTDQYPQELYIPAGMELDFGGIGKEYAVDRALGLMLAAASEHNISAAMLVNLGGDMACSGPRLKGGSWKIGIERPDTDEQSLALLSLSGGALATSGDSRRFLLKDGVRYSHILNPLTGWPIQDAPRSVTVAAPTCIQSGLIATLALLHGAGAESFLQQTGLKYWLVNAA